MHFRRKLAEASAKIVAVLLVTMLTVTAACQGAKPAAQTSTSQIGTRTVTAAPPIPAQTLPPATVAATAATMQTPTASPSPQSTEQPDLPDAPVPITLQNSATLLPAAQFRYAPWDQVLKIAWDPSGDMLAVSAGERIRLLAPDNLKLVGEIPLESWAQDVTFDSTGSLLAAADRDGLVRVWEAGSKELLSSIQAHQKIASAVAFSPLADVLATAGYDAMARLWDLTNGEKLGEMIGGTFAIPAIAFSPDGASLAIINGDIIRLRDVQTQRFVRTIAGENPFFSLAFSPDGLTLASGDVAGGIDLWDLSTEASAATEMRQSKLKMVSPGAPTSGTQGLVWQVAFNPQGTLLATAGGDGKIRIWDVGTGTLATTLDAHSKAATTVAFSPDGRWLASGGLDARVILWQVQP